MKWPGSAAKCTTGTVANWQWTGRVRRRLSVTLDASGNGTVNFDVWSANHKWAVDDLLGFTDQAQTTAPYPTVTAYLGGQQTGVAEGSTWIGNRFALRGRLEMTAADDLTVAFTGGVAGSVATVILEGDRYLWR